MRSCFEFELMRLKAVRRVTRRLTARVWAREEGKGTDIALQQRVLDCAAIGVATM
jgi:hypothetical protein